MHIKSFIFDEKVLLTGSVNMTHNGFENNKEHMYRIAEPSVVADVLADFEKEWAQADQVTPLHITQMFANYEERTDKQRKNRERSVSRNSKKSANRTLTPELDGVDEEGFMTLNSE